MPRPAIPVVASFPQDTASDSLYFNNNTLRWYTGSSGNTNIGVPCPASTVNAAQRPVLGVFQAGLTTATTPSVVGVQCTANGAHTVGVDTIRNQVYVPGGRARGRHHGIQGQHPGQTGGAANVTLGNNGTASFTPSGPASAFRAPSRT